MIGVTQPVACTGSLNGDTFQYANLIVFKNPANPNKGLLEAGDGVMGVVETTMINYGLYLGGSITELGSFDIVNSLDF